MTGLCRGHSIDSWLGFTFLDLDVTSQPKFTCIILASDDADCCPFWTCTLKQERDVTATISYEYLPVGSKVPGEGNQVGGFKPLRARLKIGDKTVVEIKWHEGVHVTLTAKAVSAWWNDYYMAGLKDAQSTGCTEQSARASIAAHEARLYIKVLDELGPRNSPAAVRAANAAFHEDVYANMEEETTFDDAGRRPGNNYWQWYHDPTWQANMARYEGLIDLPKGAPTLHEDDPCCAPEDSADNTNTQ